MITDDIFLSELLNHSVLDQRGNGIGRVKDLRVVPGEAYPLVEGLYVKGRRGLFYILLLDVDVLNRKVIAFRGCEESLVSAEPQAHEILIAEHVMDAARWSISTGPRWSGSTTFGWAGSTGISASWRLTWAWGGWSGGWGLKNPKRDPHPLAVSQAAGAGTGSPDPDHYP